MTGLQEIRGSWRRSQWAARQRAAAAREKRDIESKAFGEGRRSGIEERDRKYTLRVGLPRDRKTIVLPSDGKQDTIEIAIGPDTNRLSRPITMYLDLDQSIVRFTAEKRAWTAHDGTVVVWYNWKLAGHW